MDDPPPAEATPSRPRRWRRRALITLILLLAGAWWLNGPGLRWIGGIALRKVLAGASIDGDFRIEGTLLGGISLHDIRLTSPGTLQQLDADEVAVSYRLTELTRGQLRSLRVRSLKAVLELEPGEEEEEEEPPFDLSALPETIRTGLSIAHQYADPVDILLDDVALEIRRNDQPEFTLAPSRLIHRGPSTPIELELGAITTSAGQHIRAQQLRFDWTAERVEIDSFFTLTDWEVDDLTLDTRVDHATLLSADVVVKDRRLTLQIASDLKSGSLGFAGDPLSWSELSADLGIETEFDFLLHRLELRFSGIGQPAADWQSHADLQLTDAKWRDWEAARIQVSARQDGASATADWQLDALGGSASGSATATWPDADSLIDAPVPATAKGAVQIKQLATLFPELRQRFPIPATDTPIPGSDLDVEWSLTFSDQKPESGSAKLAIRATDPDHAPPLDLGIEWTAEDGCNLSLALPGIDLAARFSQDWMSYDSELQLSDHGIASLRPWLDPFYAVIPDALTAAASWHGKGTFEPAEHSGSLDLTSVQWSPADQPPIQSNARLEYRLPELSIAIDHLHASRDPFTLQVGGSLADQHLELTDLTVTDSSGTLVSGSASAPLPENPADWKALLASEEPWQLDLKTEPLDLARINQLLPEENAIPAAGSLQATVEISGSPAQPQIQATINGSNLQPAGDQQSIPPSKLTLQLETRDQRLEVKGRLQPDGWPELTLGADTALNTRQWANEPDTLLDTPINARAVLPPIDLARLITPPESIDKLTGTLSADIGITGTPNKPALDGGASLNNFELSTTNDRIPSITKGTAELDLKGTRITLTRLTGDTSGGTLSATGSADISDLENPRIDLRLDGKAVPTWRDESIIIRKNLSLRLAGTLTEATISGRIDLVQSLFFRDVEIIPIGIPFTTPSAPSLPKIDPRARSVSGQLVAAPFNAWKLDLAVRTEDPFLIRGNLAEGDITGEVRIGGTLGQPQPTGTLEIGKFEAELPLSRLRVSSGRAIFRPDAPFEPRLEIRASSVLRPYEINIFISGTTANPMITLTSNPPLPENEILTLLATGSTSSQLESSGAAFTKFVQLMLEEARRGRLRYGKQLQPVLEVLKDVDLRVGEADPYTGRDFTSVTVPFTDRWLTSYSLDDDGHSRAVIIFVTRFK